MNPRIFREYDIRGVADRDLDNDTVKAIGLAIGSRAYGGAVVVGRDCRTTSPRLFERLAEGILQSANVIDIGIVPTPMVYFAAHTLKPAASVMITGSHNPAEDNGFKIMVGTESLYGDDIAQLRDELPEYIALLNALPARQHPTYLTRCSLLNGYNDAVKDSLRLGTRRCKVVVDAGNGVGGMGFHLYRWLGFDVVPLYCEPDGTFPNHHPDPTQPENIRDLIAAVKHEGAELGIAFDGDADRIGAVDATGRVLWGDQLMVLFGKAILSEVPGAKFVGEVKCSQTMYDELAKAGGNVEMWKVGHSLIKARMKQCKAQLAGEMSGHMFFQHRWFGFDDGIYAGARLLELLSRGNRTLAELADKLPVAINTPEIRIDCPDDQKFAVVAAVTQSLRDDPTVRSITDIDGVRALFDGGWGLVRASNTQPALVMRCEADTSERLGEIRALIEEHIARARAAS